MKPKGLPSGTSTVDIMLPSLSITINGVVLHLQEPEADCFVQYHWEQEEFATRDDPGSDALFQLERVVIGFDCYFITRDEIVANLKVWRAQDILPLLSQEEIERITTIIENTVITEAYESSLP